MHVKASKYKQKQVKTNNVCKQKQAKVSQSKQTQVKANKIKQKQIRATKSKHKQTIKYKEKVNKKRAKAILMDHQ